MKLFKFDPRSTHALRSGLLCGLLLLCFQAQAQTQQLLNYQAIHKPVWGGRGMVVSQNEIASRIGADILREGGNAVDAAVATAFAMAVVLPRAGNIGGDGFMLVHLAAENRTLAIDYRSVAPAAASLDRYLDANGKVVGDQAGYLAAGVPGTVAGLALAHRKYGRLPWAKLLQPAIVLARDGIILTRDEAFALDWGRRRLSSSEAGAKVFLHADGSALKAGERLLQADLAWSLQQIADHGEDDFYRGAIARKLTSGMAAKGGLITLQDLKAYRAIERDALIGNYRGHRVATMPPVSGGGASLLEMLNILEYIDLAKYGAGSAQALHYMAEAIKLAWSDRSGFISDPGFAKLPVAGLVSKAYAAERAKLMSADKVLASPQLAPGDPWQYESKETTHFSVVDVEGNAVSNTYTLGSDFGAGVMIEGAGFLLGNLIGNFSLSDQLAARADPIRKPANLLAPGRRPVSSMSPTMLFRDGKVWMVAGSPGGNTIPGTVMQTIVDVVDFDMNIAEATSLPRIHQEMRTGELRVERGLSPDTLALLRSLGHTVVSGETIGSTQILMVDENGVQGAADPRRPGAAAIAE